MDFVKRGDNEMEFTKEISFEEKLTADKVAKIISHGRLHNTNYD